MGWISIDFSVRKKRAGFALPARAATTRPLRLSLETSVYAEYSPSIWYRRANVGIGDGSIAALSESWTHAAWARLSALLGSRHRPRGNNVSPADHSIGSIATRSTSR